MKANRVKTCRTVDINTSPYLYTPKIFFPDLHRSKKMTLGASKTADFRLTAEKSLA
jgi:hypothetical protein